MVSFILALIAMLGIDFLVFFLLLRVAKNDSMNYDKQFIWVDSNVKH